MFTTWSSVPTQTSVSSPTHSATASTTAETRPTSFLPSVVSLCISIIITIIIIAVTEGRQTDRKAVAVSQETSSAAERTARPVCLSHAGILSKRLNILSHFFSPVGLPHHSNFPYQTSCQYSDGDPLTGELNAGGTKKQFGTNNLFYC